MEQNGPPSQSASLPAPPGWEPLKPLPSGEVARSAGEGGFDFVIRAVYCSQADGLE